MMIDFKEKLSGVRELDDLGLLNLIEEFTNWGNDYESDYNSMKVCIEDKDRRIAELEEENTKLKETNLDLFMRVSGEPEDKDEKDEEEPEEISIDDLFEEKE